MTPYEVSLIQGRLFPALERLGWKRYESSIEHEREWSSDHVECGWMKDGVFIIRDADISEGLAEELIRLATLIGPQISTAPYDSMTVSVTPTAVLNL